VYPIGTAVVEQKRLRLAAKDAGGTTDRIAWKGWSPDKVTEAVKSGKTVFVHVTAD
jgi:hypothetical protein